MYTYRLKLPGQKDWFWISSQSPLNVGKWISYEKKAYRVRRVYMPDSNAGSLVEVDTTKEKPIDLIEVIRKPR